MTTRASYTPRQIRAHDLHPGDVIMHRGRWRHVHDRMSSEHHDDMLENFDLSPREAAMVRKYLGKGDCWMLVTLQIERRRSHKTRTRIVPIRFHDLVTVQCQTGDVYTPA